ncbi:bifunctional 2-polyprenyl-6-hydroxyphenol methylase/3-demethylubiquinol 3-O-methyltransferase UbiG [Terrihabitans sp. B22-R8]|uniref:bifunctional 2-polyprenyl-6-hydroxyphenol methylase/3-demethylubiquinol 3-O-methyltransferase UbiG n=1 Tax=Terrihabitans sp. B22-R8 TaxID=3425128 RepID=UPI00403C2A89
MRRFVAQSVDGEEVARFAASAAEWWNPKGPYAPLHKLTPSRIAYVRDRLCARFERDPKSLKSLAGLTALDVGCGGGILCEPLARLGANVTGVEPAEESIAVARAHAEAAGLAIDYQARPAEDLVAKGHTFDVVIASEVIEHVTDPAGFVKTLARLARPGGLVLVSTINRTAKSYALAIVGAEYVLRWVPRGTHDWKRFVRPSELRLHCRAAGLRPGDETGMVYDPLRDEWRLAPTDISVNYWLSAAKP